MWFPKRHPPHPPPFRSLCVARHGTPLQAILPKLISLVAFWLSSVCFKHSYGLGDDDVDEDADASSATGTAGAAPGIAPPDIAMTVLGGRLAPLPSALSSCLPACLAGCLRQLACKLVNSDLSCPDVFLPVPCRVLSCSAANFPCGALVVRTNARAGSGAAGAAAASDADFSADGGPPLSPVSPTHDSAMRDMINIARRTSVTFR